MVGDATSRYVDAHPSLCEVVSPDSNDTVTLDLPDCPKALEVVFTITFATGLIMVRVLVQWLYLLCACVYDVHTIYLIIFKWFYF